MNWWQFLGNPGAPEWTAWLHFVEAVVGACAWPLALALVLISLRRPLSSFLGSLHLRQLKFRDWAEVNFDEGLAEAAVADEEATTPPPETAPESPAPSPRDSAPSNDAAILQMQLALASPSTAVLTAWMAVERSIRRAAKRIHVIDTVAKNRRPLSSRDFAWELLHQGYIDKETFEVIDRLRTLANVARHDAGNESAIFNADALEYTRLAGHTIARLDSLGSDPAGEDERKRTRHALTQDGLFGK